jgi:hypothetical protein
LDAECDGRPEQVGLSYRLEGPNNSRVLRRTVESLERRGWRPLAEDFLNPGTPTSHVAGWRRVDTDQGTHEEWLGHWQNAAGELVAYKFERPSTTSNVVKVFGTWLPKSTVLSAPGGNRKADAANGQEAWSRYCVTQGPDLTPKSQPACATRSGITVMGGQGNLALRRGALVKASSEMDGHPVTALTDGWVDCPEWRPAAGDAQPNVSIDLMTLASISSISVHGVGSAHVTVTAGLEPAAVDNVAEYELVDDKSRVFSFPPGVVARYVHFTFRSAKGEPPRDPRDIGVREIEVFGGCVRPWD